MRRQRTRRRAGGGIAGPVSPSPGGRREPGREEEEEGVRGARAGGGRRGRGRAAAALGGKRSPAGVRPGRRALRADPPASPPPRQVDAVLRAMGKGDPNKPRGKMSSYAFFVQTCREEHKKKHPDSSVNFAEFSKKCSERWKTMSAKEKSKFEDMAKSDKARYDREMKNYVPPKGDKKGKKKDPNAPKRPPSAFFLFCSEHRPKIKSEHPGLSIGDTAKKLGEMWSEQSAKDKQPYEQKAAKLKEKYEKDIAAYRAKGKSEAGKKGPGRPTGSKKKNEQEDEEEEEEEEDEDDEEEDEDEE